MIVTYLWVITSSDSIVYLILSMLVQCGIYTSKSMLNVLKGLHYILQPSLGTVATRTFYNGWYHFPRIQKIPGHPVYAAQDHSWLMLFSAKTRSPQGRTSANALTGSSCSNSDLHIPMHINIHLYQILFMCGTCSQNLSLTYPSNILRELLIVTYLKLQVLHMLNPYSLALLYLPFWVHFISSVPAH